MGVMPDGGHRTLQARHSLSKGDSSPRVPWETFLNPFQEAFTISAQLHVCTLALVGGGVKVKSCTIVII